MKLIDFIERLRNRPPHERQMVAFGTAGSVTGIIAIAWAATFIAGSAPIVAPEAQVGAAGSAESIQQLREEFSERFEGTSAEWARMQEMLNQLEAENAPPEAQNVYGISGGGAAENTADGNMQGGAMPPVPPAPEGEIPMNASSTTPTQRSY